MVEVSHHFSLYLTHSSLNNETATAEQNTALGIRAGSSITDGLHNTFIGFEAGLDGTTSDNNTAIGWQALEGVTTGFGNICIGVHSGKDITTGHRNIFIGHVANNPTASDNIIIGQNFNSGNVTNKIIFGDSNSTYDSFSVPCLNLTFGDNSAAPTAGQVLAANASGEAVWSNGGSPTIDTSTSSATCDFTASEAFNRTVAANTTFVFTTTNLSTTQYFTWVLTVEHTGGTITWPANVVWPDGTAPTLTAGASVVHTFIFTTNDGGTTLRGAALPNYST